MSLFLNCNENKSSLYVLGKVGKAPYMNEAFNFGLDRCTGDQHQENWEKRKLVSWTSYINSIYVNGKNLAKAYALGDDWAQICVIR